MGLRASDLALVADYGDTGATLQLAGHTLAEALAWADEQFGAPRGVHLRDYDLPESPLRTGARFVGGVGLAAELAELARYYDLGLAVCARYGACRIWPHHFDLGALVGQAGIGLSPGDRYYSEPYFYMTPAPGDASVPALSAGFWRTEGWTGAVLLASDFADAPDVAHAFMASALTR